MFLQDIVCFKKLNTKKKLDLSTFMTSININQKKPELK